MDIGTHDEVPKEPEKKQSHWLFLPKSLEDHKHEIEPFVECHLLFDGSGGPCNSCVAQKLCLRLLSREQDED
ncbi:unnamed protein product [marine sediment metagenome]|uniref:Uncharacterized protein n=1 Tax=marine sediment metagenome TaxID=412755 RepID=X1NJ48_9ZZZZ